MNLIQVQPSGGPIDLSEVRLEHTLQAVLVKLKLGAHGAPDLYGLDLSQNHRYWFFLPCLNFFDRWLGKCLKSL